MPGILEDESLYARDDDGHLIRYTKAQDADRLKRVKLLIDGQSVEIEKAQQKKDAQGNPRPDAEGRIKLRPTTIFDAIAALAGTGRQPLPVLCHQEHVNPVAVCRVCSVVVKENKRGKNQFQRKLLPACQYRVEDGMEVFTIDYKPPALPPDADEAAKKDRRDLERNLTSLQQSVRVLTELLMADHLPQRHDPAGKAGPNELRALADRLEIGQPRFPRGADRDRQRRRDDSSGVIAIDHASCILCDRCSRGCNVVRQNHVIGRTGKGYSARIAFDLDDLMGKSECVSCGECAANCPTDALTFRGFVRPDPWRYEVPEPEVVATDELMRHPLFQGISRKFLDWNRGAVVRRPVRAGDVLCREGEYGSTAFLIIRGRFEASLQTTAGQVENRGRRSLFSRLFGRTRARLGDRRSQADITTDAGVLSGSRRIAKCTPDDLLIGEMTCLNNYPRSATVTALEDGEVWEILRNVLYILQRNKASRNLIEERYKQRALRSHFAAVPLLSQLNAEDKQSCITLLSAGARLTRVEPKQPIVRQGERADAFYLIRLGFVQVSQTVGGRETIINYLGPGKSFGEIGLVSDLLERHPEWGGLDHLEAGAGVRTASCTALDHVELVRIDREPFEELLARYPKVREAVLAAARDRLQADRDRQRQLSTQSLEEFVGNGLYNAQSLLVLDLTKCTRCDECTKACADTHGGHTRLVREGLRFEQFLVATSCRSCQDPVCMVGCPVGSIRREGTKEIVIEDWCIGCGLCASNCPYGNIQMIETGKLVEGVDESGAVVRRAERKATTCDLCRDIVPEGQATSCVYACPHDAAHRMSGQDLKKLVEGK